MSKIFAGIVIFPAGEEEYNISISLVSSRTKSGSLIHSESTSSPVNIASLTETVKSMILSPFAESITLTSYITSLPTAFPADRYYEIFNALESTKLVEHNYPALPLNHGEVYASSLSKRNRRTTTLLILDRSSANRLSAVSLSTEMRNKMRKNDISCELSVSLENDNTVQDALTKIMADSSKAPDQIVLINPPVTLPKCSKAQVFDIDGLIAETYPNVSVSIATSEGFAQIAAFLAYTKIKGRFWRSCGRLLTPINVATSSGRVVDVIGCPMWMYNDKDIFYVTFTNSIDNQKTATVRFLFGNHAQAKDNIESAVVVLDGLTPFPKGEARIKIVFDEISSNRDAHYDAAQIIVDQKDGPRKGFLFPRFFANFPYNDRGRYVIKQKNEPDVEELESVLQHSEKVAGKLPQ